jgi:hypothetical protein
LNRKLVCTIASLNYFAQTKSLAESIRKYTKNVDFYVLIADKIYDDTIKEKIEASDSITGIFYVDDLFINNVVELEFKYDIVELNTALKPFFLEFLLDQFHYDSVVYIDPDIMLYSNLDELFMLQETNSIILTPHLLDNTKNDRQIIDFLSYGIYNLGFISINNDINGRKLLSWWQNKLIDYCYLDLDHSLAWDQKWMDFAPAFFDSVYILKNPGYNFAYWNMNERAVTKNQNVFYVNSAYKLIFVHFSHYKPQFKNEIAHIENFELRYKIKKTPELIEIFQIYYDSLMKNDFDFYSKLPYGFSNFDNGEPIQDAHRKLYSNILKVNPHIKNPFETSHEDCFYYYSQKVFLNL